MTKALTRKRSTTSLTTVGDKAREYARASKAPNTKRAYSSAWANFTAWAAREGAQALPAAPDTVIDYLVALAGNGASLSTIEVRRAAITAAHRTAGETDPTTAEDVRMVMAGIRRELGKPPAKKAPVSLDDLRAIVAALPDTLAGQRDRALILTGFAGAFRRSELIALDVADLRINGEMKATVRRSKTDQEGRGLVKTIPTIPDRLLDPVAAMRAWLDAGGIKSGPVFRQIDRWGNCRETRLTAQSVALVLKQAAQAAGLEQRQFSGHSLRSGFITAAFGANAAEWEVQQVTGHKSVQVLRGYVQDAGLGAKRAILAAFTDHDGKQ